MDRWRANSFPRSLAMILMLGGLIYSSALAQEAPATPVTLSFKAAAQPEKKECTGGGLFGAFECATTKMEGVTEAIEGADSAGASLSLSLSSELHLLPPPGKPTVRVLGAAALPDYFGELSPEDRLLVQHDAASIAERFAALFIQLDTDQVEALNRDGRIEIDITEHFAGLEKLALDTSPVLLVVEAPLQVCIFVEREDVPDFAELVRQKKLETDRASGRVEDSQ